MRCLPKAAALAVLLLPFGPLHAAVQLPGPLVEPEWLAQHLREVRVLDVRYDPDSFYEPRPDAFTGHIPGAVLIDWEGLRAPRREDGITVYKMLPPPAVFEAMMRRSGVGAATPVVITSPGQSSDDVTTAARLYWTLKVYGHEPVALLNGGTAGWALQRRPLVHTPTDVAAGDFRAGPGRRELLATTADVQRALERGGSQLVDTRTLEYYLGLEKVPYVAAPGHLPGAVPLPHTLVVQNFPARFRPAEELRALSAAFGLDGERPSIVYCNSAALSSIVWFVLHELLGRRDTRMYDGSLHAWTQQPDRPLETMRIHLPPGAAADGAD